MAKRSTQNRLVKLAIAASLITTSFSTPLDPSRLGPRDDPASVHTTPAKQLTLDPKAFGAAIEGTSVNKAGDVFAVDFRGKGATTTSSFGFFHQTNGGVANVVGQDPIVIAKGAEDTFLAGSRFVKKGEKVLIADAQNKRVMAVDVASKKASVFCENAKMLQPNDIALSTKRDCLIFLSGQKYVETTVAGEHGDLWTCDGDKATQFSPEILTKAGVHRTNGIEVDPKGEFLYLTSAANVKGVVGSLKIFKFALDKASGALLEQDPVVFHDLSHEKGADLDGMRADVDGNLYVSLNGVGKVAKLDPSGKLLQYITTPGVKGPSNLELGGKDGKTLFAVGRCDNKDLAPGCAASIDVDKPGRAFTSLNA
ncbi:gluconolactonase [Histoplasma capsulatum]|uniref:Gluconolactonase n=1 Tax=Ajellomyces capsulatus TaxID=5037 RepID=A0A8A1LVM4_AJECA|nr:predicted protein [Histoplasma mississippiense (nom. inval.)]EDN04697.1 predicted protein [Histoplasma mississippiense (nom. inval.)]QSS57969.1 gluconolactonase [Histoplasma capsulatum]